MTLRVVTSTVAVAMLAMACNAPADRLPVVRSLVLTPNPNPTVPLAAVLNVRTEGPTRITVRIDDGEREWEATSSRDWDTEHSFPVLGMRAAHSHTITGVVEAQDGGVLETDPLVFTPPALPAEIPTPRVWASKPDEMEPGVTLFSVMRTSRESNQQDVGISVIVDARGEVVWYHLNDYGAARPRRLRNGNLIFIAGRSRIVEIDMLGNIVGQWHARTVSAIPENSIFVDTDSFHHEVIEMPNGHLMALSSEARVVDDFPTSSSDPDAPVAPSSVIGDVVVEFNREGTVIDSWSLLDVLDPHRIGHGSLENGYWQAQYAEQAETAPIRDWSHSNSVTYDPNDDSIIVSVRFQDAVVKISRATGELIWILGPHDHWREPWNQYLLEPVGDLEWQYHQHGASLVADDRVIMFDNGMYRASAFQEPTPPGQSYSRAVEFEVDPEAMTVSQTWDYGPDQDRFYSFYISETNWLPVTGNVLITDGGRRGGSGAGLRERGERRGPNRGRWARIVEVSHTEPAERVFEIALIGEFPDGYQVHRADRIPSLYP